MLSNFFPIFNVEFKIYRYFSSVLDSIKMKKEDTPKNNQRNSVDQLATLDMLKAFYNRPSQLTDDIGDPIEAPHDGSLGLLALGHIGLIEWRKSKEKFLKEKKAKAKTDAIDQTKLPDNNL